MPRPFACDTCWSVGRTLDNESCRRTDVSNLCARSRTVHHSIAHMNWLPSRLPSMKSKASRSQPGQPSSSSMIALGMVTPLSWRLEADVPNVTDACIADVAGADAAGAGADVAGAEVAGVEVVGADMVGVDVVGMDVAGAPDVAGGDVAGGEVVGMDVVGADVVGAPDVAGGEVSESVVDAWAMTAVGVEVPVPELVPSPALRRLDRRTVAASFSDDCLLLSFFFLSLPFLFFFFGGSMVAKSVRGIGVGLN